MVTSSSERPALEPAFNGFGVPFDLPSYFMLASELGYSLADTDFQELGRLLEITARRLAIVEATGRWRVRAGYREPARLVPGDVLALSSLHAMSLMVGPPTENPKDRAVYVENSALARTMLEARSYWLPAAAIEAVLTTEHLPDDLVAEIRLPVPSAGTATLSATSPGADAP